MSLTEQQGKQACARVMKHTAGPWTEDRDGDVVGTTSPNDCGDIVCTAPAGFDASMERWPYNRSLIIAAPEMLDLLCRIADQPGISHWAEEARLLVDKATK